MGYHSDPNQIGSAAWRERHNPAPVGVEMTVTGMSAVQRIAHEKQAQQARDRAASESQVPSEIYHDAKAVRAAQVEYNANVWREVEQKRITDPGVIQGMLAGFAKSETAQRIAADEQRLNDLVASKEQAKQEVWTDLTKYDENGREHRDRAWERTQYQLHRAQEDPSGSSTVNTARKAIQQASRDELPVLLNEMPLWLENRGLPTEFIEAEVIAKIPELAEAQRDLDATRRDAMVVRHDLGFIQRGIDNRQPGPEQCLIDPQAVRSRVGDPSVAVR
jgi:hypothetical protein